jgi:hypothetical protein
LLAILSNNSFYGSRPKNPFLLGASTQGHATPYRRNTEIFSRKQLEVHHTDPRTGQTTQQLSDYTRPSTDASVAKCAMFHELCPGYLGRLTPCAPKVRSKSYLDLLEKCSRPDLSRPSEVSSGAAGLEGSSDETKHSDDLESLRSDSYKTK